MCEYDLYGITLKEAAIRRLSNGRGTSRDMRLIEDLTLQTYDLNLENDPCLNKEVHLKGNLLALADVAEREGTPLTNVEKKVLEIYSRTERAYDLMDQLGLVKEEGTKKIIRKLEDNERLRIGIPAIVNDLTMVSEYLAQLTGENGIYDGTIKEIRKLYGPMLQRV